MQRAFTKGSLADAVARLRPGMKVLLPPACGEPQALVGEICRQATRLSDLMLLGGIHLGDYPWARAEHAPLRFGTWHMSPSLDDAMTRSPGRMLLLKLSDRESKKLHVCRLPLLNFIDVDGRVVATPQGQRKTTYNQLHGVSSIGHKRHLITQRSARNN